VVNPPIPPLSPDPAGPVRPPSRSSSPNGFGRRSATFEAPFVNCWRNYTQFRTLHQILDDLGTIIDIQRQSTAHDELIDRLHQHDGPRTVVILDEVDQLRRPERHLRPPQSPTICHRLHRELGGGTIQPRRRPPRKPTALHRTRSDGQPRRRAAVRHPEHSRGMGPRRGGHHRRPALPNRECDRPRRPFTTLIGDLPVLLAR
jgi:hypothetical protein